MKDAGGLPGDDDLLIVPHGLSPQKAKADDYVVATSAHIIKETVNGNIDHSAVLKSELERLTHSMAIEMTFVLQKHLPNILESIASDIRVNGIDKVYKESQTKEQYVRKLNLLNG